MTDEWVQGMVNLYRSVKTEHRIAEMMIKFARWKKLSMEFKDELETLLLVGSRHNKLREFIALNEELGAFVANWGPDKHNKINAMCRRVEEILQEEEGWHSLREDVKNAVEFTKTLCSFKDQNIVFRLPSSLRTLMEDQLEAENIKSHIGILRYLKRIQSISCPRNELASKTFEMQQQIDVRLNDFRNKIDKENSFGLTTLKAVVNDFFTDKQQLGNGNNVEGIAVVANVAGSKNKVVLKSTGPQYKDSNNILHEFVAGSVLNRMRCNSAGFMFIFGGFFCSGFELNIDSLCNIQNNDVALTTIMISEFVEGKPLADFANHPKLDEILHQLRTALRQAGSLFRFSHNDLHCNNVMVREYKTPVEVSYHLEGIATKFHTTVVPVIIDYGKVRLEFGGFAIFQITAPSAFTESNSVLLEEDRTKWYPSFDWLRCLTSLSPLMDEPRTLKKFVTESQLESDVIKQWFHSFDGTRSVVLNARDFSYTKTKDSCSAEL